MIAIGVEIIGKSAMLFRNRKWRVPGQGIDVIVSYWDRVVSPADVDMNGIRALPGVNVFIAVRELIESKVIAGVVDK